MEKRWFLYIFLWFAGAYLCAQMLPDSVFVITAVPDSLLGAAPDSVKAEQRMVPVLHVDFQGQTRRGALICHQSIAADVADIFRQLYEARYPIERVTPISHYGYDDERSMRANNTSCFCYRRVAGSQKLSKHAQGLAIDLNPLYNPHVKTRNGRLTVQPATAKPYADRSRRFAHKITRNDLACRLFREKGFRWGGDWRSSKDYQHFER